MRAFGAKLNPSRGAGALASISSSAYGRSPAYRRIHGTAQRLSDSPPGLATSQIRRDSPLTSPLLIRSSLQPQDILSRTSVLYSRHFHSRSRLAQEQKGKDDVKAKTPAEEAQKRPESAEEASSGKTQPEEPKPESEAKFSSENGEQKGEEAKEGEQKDGEAKKDTPPPPPPPHGDKTPWQVFTETLASEFKASKDWNESTKALSSGMNDFTQNETIQKMRSGYNAASDAASSTTSAALKSAGRTVGSAAAWTWDTPVVKGVRKGVNAAGSGIEKATRPMRETEAYKNVRDVIDDGSSSRYGGWVEKEERRKKRERMEAKHGRRSMEQMEEDPK